MSKDTTIISDLRSFFAKSENNRAINSIMNVMERIKIRPTLVGTTKKPNCKLTCLEVLSLLLLFPFFSVKNACAYSRSALSRLFNCEKDMFYRFMNDGNVRWRDLLYSLSLQLMRKIETRSRANGGKPRCLVIDDTDIPKTGEKSELIGRVHSHVSNKSILGHKCLTLLYTDGVSQLMLDFSLHGEEGRNKDKPQGLTRKQREARFSADHSDKVDESRVREYGMKKIDKAIQMVKEAIRRGVRFDYLLVDSWFTCASFVKLITSRHIKCHLLGMAKMGNTKYNTAYGEMTASQIIGRLRKEKLCKRNNTLKCTYASIDVKLAGTTARLFFCKRGRNSKWRVLLTTDTSLSFLKAYRTYSMRWATECAYRDCKSLLNLGKCQSAHFSAQIASFTLTFMQYNILCTVKRFESYETLGELFRQSGEETLELSVTDKIWELILDIILDVAEHLNADPALLLSALVEGNPKLHKLLNIYKLAS